MPYHIECISLDKDLTNFLCFKYWKLTYSSLIQCLLNNWISVYDKYSYTTYISIIKECDSIIFIYLLQQQQKTIINNLKKCNQITY